jgi:thioesterase domain-containing protein
MSVATLRAGDPRTPCIVCIHPILGRADVYRPLADALDWPGPVLGITAPDPRDDGHRLTDLASRYCDELDLQVPPLLLGWSIGGVIAAEMSRTLAVRGGTAGFLGILDSRAPPTEMRQRPTDRDSLARAFLQQVALTREQAPLASPPASSQPADLLAALRSLGAGDEFTDEAAVERRLRLFMALVRALFHHAPQPVPILLHLFESADAHPSHPKPPTLGWDDLAPRIERRVVDGTHFTLLAPHRIAALARTIGACLPR